MTTDVNRSIEPGHQSSPLFFGIACFIILTVIFAPYRILDGQAPGEKIRGEKEYLRPGLTGLFQSVMVVSRIPRRLAAGLASEYKKQFLTLRYPVVSAAGFFIHMKEMFAVMVGAPL